MSSGWVDSMGQNGAYWGSMESGQKIRGTSAAYDSPGFVTALGGQSTREYNGMMGSTFIPNGKRDNFSENFDEVSEHRASHNSEMKEDPPMSPQYTRLILQSDPVSTPYADSIHAVVDGASKTSYGPTKWSPEKGVPRRIL